MSHKARKRYVYTRKRQLDELPLGYFTGVTLSRDAKGHVTDVSVTSGKIPTNPVPSNNVTGSGTSGYIAKWNGTNTVTNGPAIGSDTTKYLRNDGTWAVPPGTTDISGKVNKSGDTMTGQLKTSFNQAVAIGSYQANSVTIETLIEEVRYSSGCMGSVNLTSNYTKDGITIGGAWYNFIWIPHRSGGIDGSASGDNCDYGNLLLIAMTGDRNNTYLLGFSSKNISYLRKLSLNTHTHSYTPAGTISSPFTGSAVTSGAPSKTATVASSNHTHSGTSGAPNTNGTVTVGSSDHTHSTTTGGPNSGGTTTVAAQNHTHEGTAQPIGLSNLVGVAADNHTHDVDITVSLNNGVFTGSAVTSGATGTSSRADVSTAAHTHSVSVSGTSGGPSGTTSLPNTNHTHSVTAAGSINSTFTGTAVTSGANSGSAVAALLTPSYDSTTKTLTFSTSNAAPNSHTHSVTAAGTIVSTFTGSAVTSGKPDTTNVTSVASSGHTHTSTGTASADSTNKISAAKGDHTHSVTAAGSISGLASGTGTTNDPSIIISVPSSSHTHEVSVSATGTTGTTVASSGHTHTGTSGAPSKTATVANSTHTHTTTTGAPSGTATVGSSDHTHSVTAAGTVNSTFTGTAANTGTAS